MFRHSGFFIPCYLHEVAGNFWGGETTADSDGSVVVNIGMGDKNAEKELQRLKTKLINPFAQLIALAGI